MSMSKTYYLQPSCPFTGHYPLTIADSFMVQMDSIYLYIFSAAKPLQHDEKSFLTSILTQSLETFFQRPERSPHNLPELLGKIYEDPNTGNLTVRVTPDSAVPFITSDRSSDVSFADLSPDSSFPLQPLKPSIFGLGLTTPPPKAKKGVQALWVQLTFIDGGFVIHLHIHHWIAGAASAGLFVEAWFERARLLARSLDTSSGAGISMTNVVPKCKTKFTDREELTASLNSITVPQLEHPDLLHVPGGRRVWAGMDMHPVLLLILMKIFTFMITYLPFLLPRSDVQIFHLAPEALRRLRNDVQSGAESNPEKTFTELTANDCLTALIWSCVTHARCIHRSESTKGYESTAAHSRSTILTAVDYKPRLNPPLRPNLFGNASMDVYTALPVQALFSHSEHQPSSLSQLYHIAHKIHQSISSTTDSHVRSFYQLISSRSRILDSQKRTLHFQYGNDVLCTSWEHIHREPQFLQLDILGRNLTKKGNQIIFERMRYMHSDGVDGVIVVLPAYGQKWHMHEKNGAGIARQAGLEVAISLRRESMKKLKEDEVFKQYADWGEAGGYSAFQAS